MHTNCLCHAHKNIFLQKKIEIKLSFMGHINWIANKKSTNKTINNFIIKNVLKKLYIVNLCFNFVLFLVFKVYFFKETIIYNILVYFECIQF